MKKIILFMLILLSLSVSANAYKPQPIDFVKHGGGQWIYCNNPEFVHENFLSTYENPEATYMMKNEGLKPDKYSVFYSFYNWSYVDIEADIEFKATTDTVITINSIGYSYPLASELTDCIGAWSDYLDVDIRVINETEQYAYFSGKKGLPRTITIKKGETRWISEFIYNYDVIAPRSCFNMLADFEIKSGTAEVNLSALKNYGVIGDRTHHNPNSRPGPHYGDTTVKGIETASLPITEAFLKIEIDEEVLDGENLEVSITNQYVKDNPSLYWITNLNPSSDSSMFTKYVTAGSDMLSLKYKDDSKLAYYGKNVPENQKDNIWVFDIFHMDTKWYQEGMAWKAEDHIPNKYTSEKLDIENIPNFNWETCLGNFGVTNRYHIDVKNNDTVPRSLNYFIESSLTGNVVVLRDKNNNILNPYTLERKNPFAISKGNNSERQKDCLFSVMLEPGEERQLVLDVILPTNAFGGIFNSFVVDDHKHLTEKALTEMPRTKTLNAEVFYNGEAYMKWEDGELFEYLGKGLWEHIRLPAVTRKMFASRSKEMELIKISGGYAAKFSAWDLLRYIDNTEVENKIYFLNEDFEYTHHSSVPYYISGMSYHDGTLYLSANKLYKSGDKANFTEVTDGFSIPKNNIFIKNNELYINKTKKINYEAEKPGNVQAAGEILYYKKSWKERFTDTKTKNILSVSMDGVSWTEIEFPDQFIEVFQVNYIDEMVVLNARYGNFSAEYIPPDKGITVELNNEILAFSVPAKLKNSRTMVPLRFFFEMLDADVLWLDETREILVTQNGREIRFAIDSEVAYVNGEEAVLDSPAYIESDKTLIPLRFLSENLGYRVNWNDRTQTASIFSE